MAVKRDYYEVLGLPRDASPEDIKRLSASWRFSIIPTAITIPALRINSRKSTRLMKSSRMTDKRAAYDRYGHNGADNLFGRGFEGFDMGGFGDIFEAFFGGTGRTSRQTARRGDDLRYNIKISFEEAALGCEKEIEITRTEVCSTCRGTRSKPGRSARPLPVL